MVHDDLGDLGKAVGNYGQAIILQTDNIDALINRALVYSKPGEHGSAIEDIDRVVEIDPTYAKAYLVRESAHAKLGLPQYQADLDQAVALGIDRVKAELNIAGTSLSP